MIILDKTYSSKKIGFIAGAFDIIHPGYILAFSYAKKTCEYLVVAIHDDPSNERTDKMNTILSLFERQIIFSSLKNVDEILFYKTEEELKRILKVLKPDIRYLGDDYKDKEIIGSDIDINNNTAYIYLDRSHGWSATEMKNRIKEGFE
tara:strand:+ start:17 stop:460 length:444 start_codon:yes stop_codon:yes gene_type:complete